MFFYRRGKRGDNFPYALDTELGAPLKVLLYAISLNPSLIYLKTYKVHSYLTSLMTGKIGERDTE